MRSLLTNCAGVHAIANSCNNSSNDHLRDAICCRLKRGANRQDQTSKPDTVLAAKTLAGEQTEQRSSEAANFVDGYHESLEGVAAVARCGVDLGKLVRKCCPSQETAHDTLI